MSTVPRGAVGTNNPFTMDFHQWDSFVTEVMKGEQQCDKNGSVTVFLSTNIERGDWSPEMGFGGGGSGDVPKIDLPKGTKEIERMTASRLINYDQW